MGDFFFFFRFLKNEAFLRCPPHRHRDTWVRQKSKGHPKEISPASRPAPAATGNGRALGAEGWGSTATRARREGTGRRHPPTRLRATEGKRPRPRAQPGAASEPRPAQGQDRTGPDRTGPDTPPLLLRRRRRPPPALTHPPHRCPHVPARPAAPGAASANRGAARRDPAHPRSEAEPRL